MLLFRNNLFAFYTFGTVDKQAHTIHEAARSAITHNV